MPVITIRGQLGSGAPEIGKEVARILRCDYVDRQVIEEVASLVGYPTSHVDEKEQVASGLAQRITGALVGALGRTGNVESAYERTWREPLDDGSYLDALQSVIQDLALEGNVVLVGRGSQFILRKNPSALHVLVVAPLKERIERIVSFSEIDRDEALRQIEEVDGMRRAFIQRFFKQKLENPDHYDIVLNTQHLSYDASARVIVAAAMEKTAWLHG